MDLCDYVVAPRLLLPLPSPLERGVYFFGGSRCPRVCINCSENGTEITGHVAVVVAVANVANVAVYEKRRATKVTSKRSGLGWRVKKLRIRQVRRARQAPAKAGKRVMLVRQSF